MPVKSRQINNYIVERKLPTKNNNVSLKQTTKDKIWDFQVAVLAQTT